MRNLAIITILGILCLSACSANSDQPTEQRESEIRSEVKTAFQDLANAAQTLNHDRYFSSFDSDKFTALNENGGVLHSFDAFKEMYLPQLKYVESYQSLEFNNVKIDVINASTAVLVNEYKATVTLTSGETVMASGAGTQVWSKRSGVWKLVNVSSSAKP